MLCGLPWLVIWKDVAEPSKERLSVFLEKVRQEMPKAHLELLHSGSLFVTAEAFGALLWLSASAVCCALQGCHCMAWREPSMDVNLDCGCIIEPWKIISPLQISVPFAFLVLLCYIFHITKQMQYQINIHLKIMISLIKVKRNKEAI